MVGVAKLARVITPLNAAKAQLRKKMAQKLEILENEEIVRQTDIVTDAILRASWFKNAQRVSIYVNTSGEIETERLIISCLNMGKTVFIPQFKKKNPVMRMLQLRSREEYDNLDSTLWNIRQPHQNSDAPEYQESGPLDFILMPGVAFTYDGKRLGHGMGYYDRMLAEHERLFGRQPLKVALSLNEQVVDEVPIGDTDVLLDCVIYSEPMENAAQG